MKIPAFIINLKNRTDRREHIEQEFAGRDEFCIHIVDAHTHAFGNVGLWNTIRHIVRDLVRPEDDLILICEDDHMFTPEYSTTVLLDAIDEAKRSYADVLAGGISWHEDAVQASDRLFWVSKFSGTQFIVLFKKFFKAIADADFTPLDSADAKMSALSDAIYFVYPFISVQKEFGYSDATYINNGTERVQSLFLMSAIRAKMVSNARSFYKEMVKEKDTIDYRSIEQMTVPVYIINLSERTERRAHIIEQYKDKPEFSTTIVDACKHEIGALGLWRSIRKVVQLAKDNDDDVIVICEDDHEFAADYSKEAFFRNILLAYNQGCDYLTGGTGKFEVAVPISDNLFWTTHCLSTQFIVVYRKFFERILDATFDETVVSDIKISGMTSSKMILYPFISGQKDFGHSDVTPLHNQQEGFVQAMFQYSAGRLAKMQLVYQVHQRGLETLMLEASA